MNIPGHQVGERHQGPSKILLGAVYMTCQDLARFKIAKSIEIFSEVLGGSFVLLCIEMFIFHHIVGQLNK